MKGGAPLDYVEFQLTPARTRCELVVSAGGVTEKLASGFLKPFVTHLRAADVQVARGSQAIRLEGHHNFSKQTDNTWFTKGTLERFVRFVSTPEVIERVKTIEDELGQLEQVRNALAKTFAQNEERFPRIDAAFLQIGEHSEQDAASIMPRRCSIDAGDNTADVSKRELLRAMDARLIALKQEQDLAFSRAAAAGFDSSNMADLITFAKTFGADRLNDASLQFVALLRKRKSSAGGYEEIDSPSAEAASSGSDMSLESCNEIDLSPETEEAADLKSRNSGAWLNGRKITDSGAKKRAEDWGVKTRAIENLNSSIDNDGTQTRSSTGTRRRWGPPEKLQMDYSCSQTNSSQDSPESKVEHDDKNLKECGMVSLQVGMGFSATNHVEKHFPSQHEQTVVPDSSRKLIPRHSPGDQSSEPVSKGSMFFTRLQQMAQRVEARRCEDPGGRMHEMMIGMDDLSQPSSKVVPFHLSSRASSISLDSSHSSMIPGGQAHSHIKEVQTVPSSSLSIERSSPLPAQVVQSEHSHLVRPSSVTIQNVNNSLVQNGMDKEKDCLKKPEVNPVVEGEFKSAKGNGAEPVSTSGRRLSVQAAISLFESKKVDSKEAPPRKMVKQVSRKGSMEISSPSTPEKAVLRRWNGTNSPSSKDSCLQEKVIMLDSTEARTNLELNLAKQKDGANKDNSVGTKLMKNSHCQPIVEEAVTERCKTSHFLKPEQADLLTSAEADSPAIKQHSLGSNSLNVHGEDLEKQFRIDLAKSLARVARNNAAKEMVITSKSEGDSTKTALKSTKDSPSELISEDKANGNSRKTQQEAEMKWSGPTTGHFLAKLGNFNAPKLAPLATQEHDNREQVTTTYSKQESVPAKTSEKFKETTDDDVQSISQSITKIWSGRSSGQREQKSRRQASVNFWSTPLDVHMDALVKMVDNHNRDSLSLSHEESPRRGRERFHEYYDKLRDARRRWEHPAKRAEREAKLKFMQEIFEIRISEMEERLLRPQKNDTHLAQVHLSVRKLHPQKADLLVSQMEQDELRDEEGTNQEYNSSQIQDLSNEFSNPILSASAPRLTKNQASAVKSHTVKKTVPTLSKSLTAPRALLRTAALPSPRLTQKNMSGAPSQRKSLSPSHNGSVDNSLIKSAPNSTDLMKETAKPSSARPLTSAKVNVKVHGHSRTASDGSLMADNIASANDDVLSGSADKEEMKHRLSLIKKPLTSTSELKALSAQAFDPTVLVSLKGQQEQFTDSVVCDRAKRSPMALAQEIKPFLRKGRGIGPGAGPGVMKQKISVPVDASKCSDEDGATDSLLNGETAYAYPGHRVSERQDSTKSLVADGFESSLESQNLRTSNVPVMHVLNGNRPPSVIEGLPVDFKLKALNYLPENASNYDRVCPGTFFPDDRYEEKHQGILAGDPILVTEDSFPEKSKFGQENAVLSAPISELLAWKNMDITQSNASFVSSSVPLWAGAQSHENSASPFHPAATTAASLSVTQCDSASGHLSPPSGIALDSPLGSPLSWNSTQTHFPSEPDVIRSHRPSSGPQKSGSIATPAPKEPAKGFKRLLHFGWKTRASETGTTDYVSASTTSEGDDDTEEARDLGNQSSDEFLFRARMQERGFEYGNNGDHHNFQDQRTIQTHRSSIPAPVNFKLREDHLSGATLLKAPKSFFSLPSFRNRGGDSKSR